MKMKTTLTNAFHDMTILQILVQRDILSFPPLQAGREPPAGGRGGGAVGAGPPLHPDHPPHRPHCAQGGRPTPPDQATGRLGDTSQVHRSITLDSFSSVHENPCLIDLS